MYGVKIKNLTEVHANYSVQHQDAVESMLAAVGVEPDQGSRCEKNQMYIVVECGSESCAHRVCEFLTAGLDIIHGR